MYHFTRAIIGPPAKRHLMAFGWRADDGRILNAGLVAAILQGIQTCIARKSYIFVIFQGGEPGPPVPPFGSVHWQNGLQQEIAYIKTCIALRYLSNQVTSHANRLYVLQQTACLVVNPIIVCNFAFLFDCSPTGWTSDSMMVLT